jgi:hypothetical protein
MRFLLIAFVLLPAIPAFAQGHGERLRTTAANGAIIPATCVRTNLRGGGSVGRGPGCSTPPVSLSGNFQKQCSASLVRSCPARKGEG